MLEILRHWGVAARVDCGVCVNKLGSAMAQAARKVWRDLWHRFPAPGLGGGVRAKVRLPPDPDGAAVEAFLVSTMVVGLAEIGDKTQIATVGLAARFEQFYPGVIGTRLGMMLANIPAVLLGHRLADKLPVKAIRIVTALVFAVIGVLTVARVGE
jgi:putative Ca2+/H+ antiporter (TMEM165/GDT1 family)